jgi:predicted MFS family arabinose efflux permease
VTRSLGLIYLTSFGSMISFYLMLGVTPIFAVANGHGSFGGALSTSVFMFATVAAELVTTRVMGRLGNQRALGLGAVLLCVPSLVLLLDGSLATILIVCIVRGAGFALVIIASAAMVAALAPEGKRGQGLGIYGVVVGVPSTFALPFGVALVEHLGFAPLLVISGALGMLGVLVVVVRLPASTVEEVHGMLRALRAPGVLRLAIVFSATTLASGLLLTYLPIAAGAGFSSGVAALALLAVQLSATVTRLLAGRFADRRDARLLLLPAMALIFVALLVILFAPHLVILGTAIFGAGFGLLQNASLHLMFESTGPAGYGASSAIWNIAYDIGLGTGALVFGLLGADYALGVSVALVAIAAIAAVRRSGSSASSQHTPG